MLSEVAIHARKLGKCYPIFDRPEDRLKQMLVRGRRKYYREFWAVRDVDLDVYKGETIGIIGRNGSGKSTLLQLICGTLTPTSGDLNVDGRVAALLELGAGFSPEFTGRENVYMNAAVFGLNRAETDQRFEQIATFADIGNFIDQPVKVYSSGMFVRLAFAVAVNVDADVLIVDEALAVGDVLFQNRCFRKIEQLQASGKTIVFVSHSEEMIKRHCTRALLLEKGRLIFNGSPKETIQKYHESLSIRPGGENAGAIAAENAYGQAAGQKVVNQGLAELQQDRSGAERFRDRPTYNRYERRWGVGGARILDYKISADGIDFPANVQPTQLVEFFVKYLFEKDLHGLIVGMQVKTTDGLVLFGVNTKDLHGSTFEGVRGEIAIAKFEFRPRLNTGQYFISVGVSQLNPNGGGDIVPLDRRWDSIVLSVQGDHRFHGLVDMGADITLMDRRMSERIDDESASTKVSGIVQVAR